MKILVNVQSLQPPVTGIGRYTTELLNQLILDNNIQAFDVTKNYTKQQLEKKLKNVNNPLLNSNTQRNLSHTFKKIVKNMPCAYALRQLIQQQINKPHLKECSDYIYWEPNYLLQPFDGKSVATIHDLSYIQYPQYYTSASLKWLEKNIEASITQAGAIVTLSEFSKKEILTNFSIPESKISIVPPAVSDDFKQAVTEENIAKIKEKYQLPYRYILSVGTLEPRKNIKSLLQAYSLLPNKIKQDYPLVLVGTKGWGEVVTELQAMIDKKEVLVLGYIAQEDIPILYKAADLFVYISLYEGYGMPIAEAIASGLAVITSENSAMSEVAQNKVELVNPLDIEQISNAMQLYLQDREAKNELIEKSTSIIKEWSWKKSAEKLKVTLQNVT